MSSLTDTTQTKPAAASPKAQGDALKVAPSDGFVSTPEVDTVAERAAVYLEAGYPVHLAGPAGTGKTTLAFHIAARRGRPVSLLHGNEAFNGTDLAGRDSGYRKSTTVDNFIHSVLKTEESVDVNWIDNRLTKACEHGHTLIYDEFNRTRAEANNILLSLLEEGILSIPRAGGGYIRVHPEFRMILTSNPAEYAGVHKAQDALLDRLITVRCQHYDATTETRIVASASGIDQGDAHAIVCLVRALRGERGDADQPSIRAAIALARVCVIAEITIDPDDASFIAMAFDVLGDAGAQLLDTGSKATRAEFTDLVRLVLAADTRTAA
ncbi:MAG: gas vesicle protein GvpN [Planctomycetota bacterium]